MRTRSGTMLHAGIEYKYYPPPAVLIKMMKRIHATPLVRNGILRLSNVTSYQEFENAQLGDRNDSSGMYRINGHEYTTGTVNPIYLFCMSLHKISVVRQLEIANSEGYDCILEITKPEIFFKKVLAALNARKGTYWLHCGKVKYDRGSEVTIRGLNTQQYNHNVFQKAPPFNRDKEYRLAVTDNSLHPRSMKHMNLVLGRCSSIMKITKLPNQAL